MLRTGAILLTGIASLAGCVYPMTNDSIQVAENARALSPAERSVMRLSPQRGGYIAIAPDIPGLPWNVFRENYFPPGAIAVVPGTHAFVGDRFWADCRFELNMAAGHEYRPADHHCRTSIPAGGAGVPEAALACLASNPASRCCTAVEDVSRGGTRDTLLIACDPNHPYPGYPGK